MIEKARGEKIAEGKTKIIWEFRGNKDFVLIELKDDITAGNGAKRDVIPGKGRLATTTTCNVFKYLIGKGLNTHYIGQADPRTFVAWRVKMIPLELVARRVATGSYLKRYPEVREGTVFRTIETELFLKNDSCCDPLLIWDNEKDCFQLYEAKKPTTKGYLGTLEEDIDGLPKEFGEVMDLHFIASEIFIVLERAWKKQDVTLVDLKIECGFTNCNGFVIADVIDNDSWRIWPGGDKNRMLDKQVYRDADAEITAEKFELLRRNYLSVAEATSRFLE